MVRRTITAALWLFAVWTAGGALSLYAGMPALLGPAAGLAIASLVWWDPSGRLWKPAADAALRRRRVADLPRVSEAAPEAELQREPGSARS